MTHLENHPFWKRRYIFIRLIHGVYFPASHLSFFWVCILEKTSKRQIFNPPERVPVPNQPKRCEPDLHLRIVTLQPWRLYRNNICPNLPHKMFREPQLTPYFWAGKKKLKTRPFPSKTRGIVISRKTHTSGDSSRDLSVSLVGGHDSPLERVTQPSFSKVTRNHLVSDIKWYTPWN